MEEDIKAIKECELFVLYNGERKSGGKYIELGIAIAFNKPVVIYGNNITSIYKSRTHHNKLISDLPNLINEKEVKNPV